MLKLLCVSLFLTCVSSQVEGPVQLLQGGETNSAYRAVAKIQGVGLVSGSVSFRQEGGNVSIQVQLKGLTPSTKHGLTVHEFGDISEQCDNIGPHFNPLRKNHGAPDALERHVGDLGNLETDLWGRVEKRFIDDILSLNGENSIIGRTIVVHEYVDDLGNGDNKESKQSGNSGPAIACGVIGIA